MSFPITCTACNKTFTISDEIYEKKVAGRVVTIKCKACGQGIRVDGTKGGAAASPPAEPAPAAAPAAVPAPAPVSDEPLWAVDYPDGQDREFTTAEVVAEIERGAVEGSTLVWRDGMAEWLELSQVPELASELAKIEAKKKAAAQAAAAAAAKAAPVHKPRAPMPTVTGLAGLPGAGAIKPREQAKPAAAPAAATPLPKPAAAAAATPLPKPRAAQPSTPELLKPRAAQSSTPELLKPRAAQPSTPELLRPRAQQPSAPVLPKPPGPPPFAAPPPAPPPAAPPFAAIAPAPPPMPPPPFAAPPPPLPMPAVAEAPTPPLPASVAKVVSAPPQVPAFPASPMVAAPLPTGPALVADHASVEWPEAKSKKPLVIGGVVVAALAIGGAVLALGGKEAPPPSTPISAAPPTPAATPTPPAATPTPESGSAQSAADTASGSDPVATSPDSGTTPGAGFAEMFAAGARKAESKGATVAPSGRFDAAATKAPLAQAATDAQACKQSGGPTGKVTVVVTFDPNGKVSSATITEAPFAGTATGNCISAALKRATIPPFSGLPGSVSKTFSIL